jgi:hypothetical protein
MEHDYDSKEEAAELYADCKEDMAEDREDDDD